MKLLITGATGMIGSAIVREALKSNNEISCIVRRNSERIYNVDNNRRVHIIECNIDEYNSLVLDDKYDVFIHLAWAKTSVSGRDDVDTQIMNIQYSLDAVRLAKRCGCEVFIGAGSQAEYGIQTGPLTPNTPVKPESGYGIAKYSAGKMCNLLCSQLGIRFNWLRILSIYGENDGPNTLISYVIKELKENRSPELTKCEQIWDYLNCNDAARAFLAVAEKGKSGVFYPLGSGNGRPISEYVKEIQCIVNPKINIEFGKKNYYPHQPMYLVSDNTQLSNDTGWVPKVEFSDGIKNIIGIINV